MAFQPVPNTVEVSLHFQSGGNPIINTLYYARTSVPLLTELQELADNIDLAVSTSMLPLLPQACGYTHTEVLGLSSETDIRVGADVYAADGGDTHAGLPINVTKAIKRVSAYTGRSARGRVYWPQLPENQLYPDAEHLYLGRCEQMRDVYVDFDGVASGFGWTPVIVSRYSAGVKRSVGITFNIEAWEFDNTTTDSMRGRLPRT